MKELLASERSPTGIMTRDQFERPMKIKGLRAARYYQEIAIERVGTKCRGGKAANPH
ncbi:MAG: hypothetical protein U0903_01715 [Planctomycetales bacterium]